jgi:hypothetical protein
LVLGGSSVGELVVQLLAQLGKLLAFEHADDEPSPGLAGARQGGEHELEDALFAEGMGG